jgi:hypothetical protein
VRETQCEKGRVGSVQCLDQESGERRSIGSAVEGKGSGARLAGLGDDGVITIGQGEKSFTERHVGHVDVGRQLSRRLPFVFLRDVSGRWGWGVSLDGNGLS